MRTAEDERRERFEALYREHFRAMYLAARRALTGEGAETDAAVLDERDVLLEYESAENRDELCLLVRAFCKGESYADIAAELGISVAAVKKRVQRAKERLRAQLEAESHL